MTSYRAIQRNARVSPRKARLSVDLIRGRKVPVALDVLQFNPRRASVFVRKVLMSAVASAQQRGGVDAMDLTVVKTYVDKGVTLKRTRPCARGRANRIEKKCSHILIEVATAE